MTETEHRRDNGGPASGREPVPAEEENAREAAAATESLKGPRPARTGLVGFVAIFALACGVLAAVMAGFLWWQYREFYVSLDAADRETTLVLESVRENVRRVDERIDTLRAALDTQRTRDASMADRLDRLPGQLAALEQRIAATQGGSPDTRSRWLRAEAEYYLSVANTELALADKWEAAIAALELADDRLAELANPAYTPVRELIADELIALRAVRLPDIDGLAFSLSRLAERTAALPVSTGSPAATAPVLDDAQPGLERLWLGVKSAFAGIIRVERSDVPVARVLSAEERRLVERQVVLELQLARIAALRSEALAFQASLATAVESLRRNFDATTPELEGAIELLEQMRVLDIAPAKPDISRSLNRLRSIPAGDD